jgi:hypothetical protein
VRKTFSLNPRSFAFFILQLMTCLHALQYCMSEQSKNKLIWHYILSDARQNILVDMLLSSTLNMHYPSTLNAGTICLCRKTTKVLPFTIIIFLSFVLFFQPFYLPPLYAFYVKLFPAYSHINTNVSFSSSWML